MFGIGVPELIVIMIFWVIPGTIGAIIAKNKGRSAVGWFFFSAIFWLPIVIVIFCLRQKKSLENIGNANHAEK
jgi:hypothetical protein